MADVQLSVVIPVYRSERTLNTLVNRLIATLRPIGPQLRDRAGRRLQP